MTEKIICEKVPADVIYKSFLQNDNSSAHLSHLVDQAEEFNAKNSDYDIIKEYLQLSGNCQEILQFVKELSASDSQNASLLLKALCHLLIRVASDLHVYIAAGTSIVNEILAYGMKTIFNFLKFKQKSTRTKLALHLLSSMVALGNQTALQVVAKLDFSNVNFVHLLHRTNFSEDEDVRTAFLNLIVLIITMSNNNVIRQIVEVKGFLNNVFPGLVSDRVSTITLVLNTFRDKIIENANIPKTNKVRLFNDNSLSSVIKLYTWKGPLRNKTHRKRKLGEDVNSMAFEVSEEDASEVHTCAHQFMLALCCSYKNGIIFRDPSLGVSGRNLNHIITNILKSLTKPYADPLISEFVISVLQACPDQLRFYLPLLKDSFTPRLSTLWLNAVNFLKKVMESQDPIAALFKSDNKRPVSALLNIAKTFCLLDVFNAPELIIVLSQGHHVMCYYLCCFLSSVLRQVKTIVDFTLNHNSTELLYDSSDLLAFRRSFLSLVFQNFPIVNELQNSWCKITTETMDTSENALKDIPVPSLSEELMAVLEVMKLFRTLSYNANKDFDVDLPTMFGNIKECSTLLSNKDFSNIYISIVDLLSADDSFALWNKKITDTPLMAIVDVYQAAHKSKDLLGAKNIMYKVLLHTKVFDHCQWEINAWLESLEYSKSKHIPFIFEFINDAIYTLLQEPNRFLVKENILETSRISTDGGHNLERLEEVSSVQSEQQQCFSSFVPAVLFTLQNLEKKGCQLFVERALVVIMHRQYSARALFRIIKQYSSVISPSLFAYLEILVSPKREIPDRVLVLSNSAHCNLDLGGHLRRNFMSNHSSDASVETCSCNMISLLKSLDVSSVREVIWQILTYIQFETTLILKTQNQDTAVVNYLTFLEQLLNFLSLDTEDVDDQNSKDATSETSDKPTNKSSVIEIVKETLNHPIILRLFLGIAPNNSHIYLNDSIIASTKLVLNNLKKIFDWGDKTSYSCLVPFKNKIVEFIQDENNSAICGDSEFVTILEAFSPLFTADDIVILLEILLNFNKEDQDFASVFLLMDMFLENKFVLLLSPKCFNSIILRYVTISKKYKKLLRKYLLQLLHGHPSYSLLLTEDSASLLLQQNSVKDLPILGILVDSSDKFRHAIQTSIADTTLEEQNTVHFLYLASKCIANCVAGDNHDADFKNGISTRFWLMLSEFVLNDVNENFDLLKECNVGKAAKLILQEKYTSPKKFNEFCKKLLEKEIPSPSKMCVLLQLFEIWKFYKLENDKTGLLVLRIICSWLCVSLSAEFTCWELTTFIIDLLKSIDGDVEMTDIVDVNDFFSNSLKIALKSETVGKEVLKILALLCEKSKVGNLPIQSLYGLVTGHSSFFQVMLTEKVEENSLKESLIDLLITLTKLDGSVCKENHFGLFLSSYEATMTTVDQKLLFLMKLYSDNGINMITYSPFLWGKPAIGHYSVMSSTQMYLWKQPKLQDVLSIFLPEKIECSALNYPLNGALQPSLQCLEVDATLSNKMYDLRFVLPLFANLLSPGSFVHCSKFIESKVLMLIFSSLGSLDSGIRALGYYCLSQFYQHLEGANFREKGIWLCLLNSVRNSITSLNPKIPSIITLFLARAADIFTKPEHNLYPVVYKFIMVKPCLDIGQVPEFYKLFNSVEIEHRIQRLWLLNLIGDGLRTSLDFHICEKRYIFSILQHYYFTAMPSSQEKIAILQIIGSAVKVPSSSRTLCENGLLVWLQYAIMKSDSEALKEQLCLVLESLQKTINQKFSLQFSKIHLRLLEKIKLINNN